MILEMMPGKLQTLTPILDLWQNAFKATKVTMHPDTWQRLLTHYELPVDTRKPDLINLWDDIPFGQALFLPRADFVLLDFSPQGK